MPCTNLVVVHRDGQLWIVVANLVEVDVDEAVVRVAQLSHSVSSRVHDRVVASCSNSSAEIL